MSVEHFQTIIFDMDGTLVSSLSCIYHCVNEISNKYVHSALTLEQIIANFGPPARTIIKQLTSSLPPDRQNQAVSDYYECYKSNVSNSVLVFPGITTLLEKIRRSGKHLALLTGVEKRMMDYTLDPFDLSKLFEIRISSDDVQKSKPDPEGVKLILAKTKTPPRETILIGDSPADIQAGKSAGTLTGAALWSPENRGDPTKENPDYEFRSIKQLSDFLFPEKAKNDEAFYFGPQWKEERNGQ